MPHACACRHIAQGNEHVSTRVEARSEQHTLEHRGSFNNGNTLKRRKWLDARHVLYEHGLVIGGKARDLE